MVDKKEIKSCVRAIKKRLNEKAMNHADNSSAKIGYVKTLEILEKKLCTYADANIADMPTTQSRAIAVLAVDFLNGECTEMVLAGVPIKRG